MTKLTVDYLENQYNATLEQLQIENGITYEIKITDNDLIKIFEGKSVFHINPTIPNGLNIISWDENNKEFQIAICHAIFLARVYKSGFISYS